jgi:hypothetical protein
MADEQSPDQPVDVSAITEQVLAKIAEHVGADVFTDMLGKSLLKALTALAQGIGDSLKGIARLGGKALVAAEEPVLPIFASSSSPSSATCLAAKCQAVRSRAAATAARAAEGARALVNAYMDAIADANAGGLEPSDEGAKRIAGAAVHATLEGWFNGWILEMLGDCVPIEWMHFKDLTELSEEVIRSLGVGRLVRRAVAPLVDVAAATPMRWKVNKQYRPTLLSPAQAIRQAYRGNWDWADVQEICEREGYSDAAISALINEQRKFQSVATCGSSSPAASGRPTAGCSICATKVTTRTARRSRCASKGCDASSSTRRASRRRCSPPSSRGTSTTHVRARPRHRDRPAGGACPAHRARADSPRTERQAALRERRARRRQGGHSRDGRLPRLARRARATTTTTP